MYKIEKKPYGFKLTFADAITLEEMTKWAEESKTALIGAPQKFGVLVDMRTLKPLGHDVQTVMVEGQKQYKVKGMERSAVAVANTIIQMQFKRLAHDSGIYQWERYIDASKDARWETTAENWITSGQDPDK